MQQFSIFMWQFIIYNTARVENTNNVTEVAFLHLFFGESGLVGKCIVT